MKTFVLVSMAFCFQLHGESNPSRERNQILDLTKEEIKIDGKACGKYFRYSQTPQGVVVSFLVEQSGHTGFVVSLPQKQIVPEEALQEEPSAEFVYSVEQGKIHQAFIQVGAQVHKKSQECLPPLLKKSK